MAATRRLARRAVAPRRVHRHRHLQPPQRPPAPGRPQTREFPVSPPPATPGRNRRATGRRPEYVVEIDISPQLRARDPGRPLSLSEALDTGPARRRDTAARGPEVRPARHPAATPAGSQLPGTLQPTA